jgi:hypothetical protein
MSEYQYYEFQTIDRPLTPKEQAEIKELSCEASPDSAILNDFAHGYKKSTNIPIGAFLYLLPIDEGQYFRRSRFKPLRLFRTFIPDGKIWLAQHRSSLANRVHL